MYSRTGTHIVVYLVLIFMNFVKRRGTEVRDGDAAACIQREEEHQASSPMVQFLCVQLPLIKRDPGQVDFTPVHTNVHRTQAFTNCMLMQINGCSHVWSHTCTGIKYRHKSK